jgi:hypothetical protein
VSEAVNRNDRRNGNDYHSVGTVYGIENEGVAGDDHYLPSHSHDVNVVVGDGKDVCHRGRLDKWVSVAPNGVSEKMLVKRGSRLTIDMTIVDVRYVR